jgi:hypothetical protein
VPPGVGAGQDYVATPTCLRFADARRILLPPLAMIARWLGKDKVIDRYLDLATHPSAQAGLGQLPSGSCEARSTARVGP